MIVDLEFERVETVKLAEVFEFVENCDCGFDFANVDEEIPVDLLDYE